MEEQHGELRINNTKVYTFIRILTLRIAKICSRMPNKWAGLLKSRGAGRISKFNKRREESEFKKRLKMILRDGKNQKRLS